MENKLLSVEKLKSFLFKHKSIVDVYERYDTDKTALDRDNYNLCRLSITEKTAILPYAEALEAEKSYHRDTKEEADLIIAELKADIQQLEKQVEDKDKGLARYKKKVESMQDRLDFFTGADKIKAIIEKNGVERYLKSTPPDSNSKELEQQDRMKEV